MCNIDGCDLPVRSMGMCEMHYQRDRRARRTVQKLHDRLDEVEHLIDGGVWPETAARRCGWGIPGAEGAARKAGRDRLVRIFAAQRAMSKSGRLVA